MKHCVFDAETDRAESDKGNRQRGVPEIKYIIGGEVGSRLYEMRYADRYDPEYPPYLKQYERMPAGLYVIGRFPDPSRPCVAIVGARNCSGYGKSEAERFGKTLAENGVQIISGLAYGIDVSSQIGALRGGGTAFAVLGSGADVCYPKENRSVYDEIIRNGGGIISEYEPGTKAAPWHFPLRNRIISALADIVLVIEARKKSGSLITVEYALEQGKSVFAIPGRNVDALSFGCNALISQGAGIAVSPEVILEELALCRMNASYSDEENSRDRADLPIDHGGRTAGGKKYTESDQEKDISSARPGSKEGNTRGRHILNSEALRRAGQLKQKEKKRLGKPWSEDPAVVKVYECIDENGKSLDMLMEETGLQAGVLTGALISLSLEKYVYVPAEGYYAYME